MSLERDRTIEYILERRCTSGGFCFYRLDEPNAADTYWALASLDLLGAPLPADAATVAFLKGFQHPEGGFENGYIGHAVLRGLRLLGQCPERDPVAWVYQSLSQRGGSVRPVESASMFDQIYLLADLSAALEIAIPLEIREDVTTYILRYRNPDSGFGNPASTLMETSQALTVLAGLGHPAASLQESLKFLRMCEDPSFGFLAVPGSRPSYLEHIHAGLLGCSVLGYPPPVLDPCQEFIERCRIGNGGYTRSVYGGSSTLEYTYLALEGLALINRIRGFCG